MKFALLLFVCFAVAYSVQATGCTGGCPTNPPATTPSCSGGGTTQGSGGGTTQGSGGGTTQGSGGGTTKTSVTTISPQTCCYCGDNTLLGSLTCFLRGVLGVVGLLSPGGSQATCISCNPPLTAQSDLLSRIICLVQQLINDLIGSGGTTDKGDGCYWCGNPKPTLIDDLICLLRQVTSIVGLNKGTSASNCAQCVKGGLNLSILDQVVCALQTLLTNVLGSG